MAARHLSGVPVAGRPERVPLAGPLTAGSTGVGARRKLVAGRARRGISVLALVGSTLAVVVGCAAPGGGPSPLMPLAHDLPADTNWRLPATRPPDLIDAGLSSGNDRTAPRCAARDRPPLPSGDVEPSAVGAPLPRAHPVIPRLGRRRPEPHGGRVNRERQLPAPCVGPGHRRATPNHTGSGRRPGGPAHAGRDRGDLVPRRDGCRDGHVRRRALRRARGAGAAAGGPAERAGARAWRSAVAGRSPR